MTMPRGNGAKTRRSARRAADPGTLVKGARRALDPDPAAASASAPAPATDAELDALVESLAPKVGTCANCSHMALLHNGGVGSCSADGCSCTTFEAEAAASLTDAVEYADEPAGFGVIGFDPADDRFDAAVAALIDRTPAAEPLVRLSLNELRLRHFAPAPATPAPPLTEPLDAGGNRYTLEWDAVLCPEGKMTEDGRAFAPGAIRWRDLPLTLSAMLKTQEGHDGAKVCGRIDLIWRDEAAGLIRASGVFDDSEFGREIARMVADGILRGNSVDIAPLEVEVGPVSRWFDPEGNWIPQTEAATADEPSFEDILFGDPAGEPTVVVVNDAVIGMSTVCPFPAFADAHITVGQSVVAAGSPLVWTLTLDAGYRLTRRPAEEPLTAAAEAPAEPAPLLDAEAVAESLGLNLPVHPPAAWFANPELEHLSPLTVTDEGRLFGHAAGWGACHTGFPDVCVIPPSSVTGYRFYLLKTVKCDDGTEVAVGTITLEAPHANQRLGLVDASAHYDNTGMAAADVVVGEDDYGIWVAGALRPHLTPEMVRELRGASLSGDWRNYDGNLELVALLAVNVPGFPIPKVQTRIAAGVPLALVAAGVLNPDEPLPEAAAWLPPAVDATTAAKLVALASPVLATIAE